MITWRRGTVQSIDKVWPGVQQVTLLLPDGETMPALSYPELVGELTVGIEVTANSNAVDRNLGTGGFALVVSQTDPPVRRDAEWPGHLVKARYTPLQTMVLGADEQDSPVHRVLAEADDLEGMPVITADLHSALPAIIAGLRLGADRAGRPPLKVAYVMSDGGALPIWLSRTVAGLQEAGWLDATVTVGQAFGGDLEAVSVHTGLLAAHLVAETDVAIVSQGPGNLGTGTRWGFSGVNVGEAINAVGVLGGRAIGSLRMSNADARPRHQGISHHSLTAYGRVALSPAVLAFPVLDDARLTMPDELTATIAGHRRALAESRHDVVDVIADAEVYAALENSPVRLSTMGRGLDADPLSFVAAAVAGVYAGSLPLL